MKVNNKRRENIGAAITAALLSVLQVLGYSFSKYDSWDIWFQNFESRIFFFSFTVLVAILFFIIIKIFWRVIQNSKQDEIDTDYKIKKKQVIKLAILFIVLWLPYIVILYPCSMNPDVMDQIGQFFHIDSMCWTQRYVNLPNPTESFWNNHHPVFHTLIVGTFVWIGKQIHNIGIGLFGMVVLQTILMATVFSYAVLYMKKRNVSKKFLYFAAAFYGLWPIHGFTATTLCKDTLFNVWIFYSTIRIIQMVEKPQKVLTKRFVFWNIVNFTIMGLLRNNGVYLLFVMLFIILVLMKGYRKKILISFGIPVFFLGIVLPKMIFPILDIAPGSKREMLSVPLQQIARVVKEGEVEQDDLDIIETALCSGRDYHEIIKRYDPKRADPIKNYYNLNLSKSEEKELFKVWLKYLRKCPLTYIQAAINNSYQYIYYERYSESAAYVYYNGITANNGEILGVKNNQRFKDQRDQLYKIVTKIQHSKILGWTVNIGFYMCVFIVLTVKCLVDRKYRLFWSFGLIMGNIAINFLGPVVYMRYVYFFIICIPLYLGLLMIERRRK